MVLANLVVGYHVVPLLAIVAFTVDNTLLLGVGGYDPGDSTFDDPPRRCWGPACCSCCSSASSSSA
jgi:hypothetical protein